MREVVDGLVSANVDVRPLVDTGGGERARYPGAQIERRRAGFRTAPNDGSGLLRHPREVVHAELVVRLRDARAHDRTDGWATPLANGIHGCTDHACSETTPAAVHRSRGAPGDESDRRAVRDQHHER